MQKYGTTGPNDNGMNPTASPKRNVLIRKFNQWKERMNLTKTERASLKDELSSQKPLTEGISDKRVARVDKAGVISYYLVVGGVIDIISGLTATGIAVARSVSIAANSTVLGKWYGMWREKVYKLMGTAEESSKTKKYFTELIAYIPFRTPVYTVSNIVGNLVQEGRIDLQKALVGTGLFLLYAPLASPILGAWMDRLRGVFGIRPASEGAYGNPALAEVQPARKRTHLRAKLHDIAEKFDGMVDKLLGSPLLERAGLAVQTAILAIYLSSMVSAVGKFAVSNDPKDKKAVNPMEQIMQKAGDRTKTSKDSDDNLVFFMNVS